MSTYLFPIDPRPLVDCECLIIDDVVLCERHVADLFDLNFHHGTK